MKKIQKKPVEKRDMVKRINSSRGTINHWGQFTNLTPDSSVVTVTVSVGFGFKKIKNIIY